MKFVIVVAASENNVIGINNKMPWHLPDDLKFFKKTTLGHPIVMGKNTWASIGQKPLPGRLNIVISTSLKDVPEGVVVCASVSQMKAYLQENYTFQDEEKTVCIIGGGHLYRSVMEETDAIFMTRIHMDIDNGMVFFPEIRHGGWQKVWEEYHPKDERHAVDFTFEKWIKSDKE